MPEFTTSRPGAAETGDLNQNARLPPWRHANRIRGNCAASATWSSSTNLPPAADPGAVGAPRPHPTAPSPDEGGGSEAQPTVIRPRHASGGPPRAPCTLTTDHPHAPGSTAAIEWPISGSQITAWSILVSFVVVAAVGLIFDIYPSVVASRQDPIKALRHD